MPKDIKEESVSDEDLYRQRLEDLREVVEVTSGAGKRFLRRIMEDGAVYRTTYTGNVRTNFLEGRRSIATEIIADLEQVASRKDRADILL